MSTVDSVTPLIHDWLRKECPKAARAMELRAELDDSDDDCMKSGAELINAKRCNNSATLQQMVARQFMGNGALSGIKKESNTSSKKSTPLPTPVQKAKSVSKKSTPMPTPTQKAKKTSKKSSPLSTPLQKPKPVVKKERVISDDSDDSDGDALKKPVVKISAKQVATKKMADNSDSDDDLPKRPPAKIAVPIENAEEAPKNPKPKKIQKEVNIFSNAGKKEQGERFCRVDVNAVKFVDERLKDNTPGQEAMCFLQNQKMLAVRGKEFNKHKQKNKSKLYAPPSGVDLSVRSYQFHYSSDDE